MQMTNPQVHFPRNLEEEGNISWTAGIFLAVFIIFSSVPFGLLADWLKPVDALMSILP